MSKYANEFKVNVVEYCINENQGYTDTAEHFIKGKYITLWRNG